MGVELIEEPEGLLPAGELMIPAVLPGRCPSNPRRGALTGESGDLPRQVGQAALGEQGGQWYGHTGLHLDKARKLYRLQRIKPIAGYGLGHIHLSRLDPQFGLKEGRQPGLH